MFLVDLTSTIIKGCKPIPDISSRLDTNQKFKFLCSIVHCSSIRGTIVENIYNYNFTYNLLYYILYNEYCNVCRYVDITIQIFVYNDKYIYIYPNHSSFSGLLRLHPARTRGKVNKKMKKSNPIICQIISSRARMIQSRTRPAKFTCSSQDDLYQFIFSHYRLICKLWESFETLIAHTQIF